MRWKSRDGGVQRILGLAACGWSTGIFTALILVLGGRVQRCGRRITEGRIS
jgi:hypothetical protein